MNKLLYLKFLLPCFFFANAAVAQVTSKDSLQNTLAGSYPVKLYYNAIGENAHIYNGYEYFTPDRNIKGSPFYLSDSPVPSSFTYDDSYYQNIPILYDQVHDLVVINRLGQNFKISLINSKLAGFALRNHNFVRLSGDTVAEKKSSVGAPVIIGFHGATGFTYGSSYPVDRKKVFTSGFYDCIYTGKSAVFVKRKKYVKEVLEYSNVVTEYIEDYKYYILFEGEYHELTGKSNILELFKSKKSEIKSYLRKNKLNFKTDFEKTLIATSAYYDQLTS